MTTEWERELGHVRDDMKEIRESLGRLEGLMASQTDHFVSQGQWSTWKSEIWTPTQERSARMLRDIERRTNFWLGLLGGTIITGLMTLVVHLLLATAAKGG